MIFGCSIIVLKDGFSDSKFAIYTLLKSSEIFFYKYCGELWGIV